MTLPAGWLLQFPLATSGSIRLLDLTEDGGIGFWSALHDATSGSGEPETYRRQPAYSRKMRHVTIEKDDAGNLGVKSGFVTGRSHGAPATGHYALCKSKLRIMPESIQDRVLKVIATTKRIPLENVKPDSTFDSLSIDSLDRLNILFDLESEFDIEIDDADAKQVASIPQMVEGVSALMTAKEAGLPAPHFPQYGAPTQAGE